MNPQRVVAVLLCCLLTLPVDSSPIMPHEPSWQLMVEHTKTLAEKIVRDIPSVHGAVVHAEGLTLNPDQHAHLHVMVTSLGIPEAPVLKPLSQHFPLEVCVSRMSAGVRLHQELLEGLGPDVSQVTDLTADLRDLSTNISKMKELIELSEDADKQQRVDLASRVHGNFDAEVALHLTLQQLRSFCHDLVRILRHIATYRPPETVTV